MPLEGQLESERHAGDNRKAVRRRLHLAASGSSPDGSGISVLVHDISESGILLQTAARLSIGERIEVMLPHAGATAASVVWASGEFLGCQFEEAISHAALSAALLRSDSRAGEAPAPIPLDETFGMRLRRLRRERTISLIGLARLLNVSKPTVWKWERDDARPRKAAIEALAAALGVSEAELLFGDGPARPVALGTPKDLPGSGSHGLNEVVKACKERIAGAVGTSPHNVSVSIRL
jgi:transcriptional regulator with XRE-family HTH domain